jgi:hypothetical protein
MNLSPSTRFRLIGVFPLIFFFAQGVHDWRIDQLGHMLWMCNLGNLMLAMGLFLAKPLVIRPAAIWMVPGLIVWFVYVVLPWGVFLSSTLAHVGGLTVAAIALSKFRMDRKAWRLAFGWYLMVQLASRFVTPAELNVNLAHGIQSGWERSFDSYFMFWVTLTLVTLVIVWLSGLLLWRIWPRSAKAL